MRQRDHKTIPLVETSGCCCVVVFFFWNKIYGRLRAMHTTINLHWLYAGWMVSIYNGPCYTMFKFILLCESLVLNGIIFNNIAYYTSRMYHLANFTTYTLYSTKKKTIFKFYVFLEFFILFFFCCCSVIKSLCVLDEWSSS